MVDAVHTCLSVCGGAVGRESGGGEVIYIQESDEGYTDKLVRDPCKE